MIEYEPPVYRPPGEWRSFLVQATIGCSHNGCTFCGMYKGKKFRVRDLDDILWDIRSTAAMFNQVHPRRITSTGMTVFPHTPVADMAQRGQFTEANEREKIEELLTFLEHLTVDTFYDGIHYLNPLNYRFANSNKQDKSRVLDDIRETLRTCSDEELEQMVSRKQMQSL